MSWLFYALLARFLWASSCAVDQLFSRSHKDARIVSSMILYFCSALPLALFALWMADDFTLNAPFIGWIVVGAVISVIAILPYYKCLQTDDAHSIMPFFELTPVFLVVLAFLVQGEALNPVQLLGGFIVVVCGFLFSWDFRHGHIRARTLGLMSLSALLYAFYQLSISSVSDSVDGWAVSGSLMLVESLLGFIGLATYKRARVSIVATLIETKGRSLMMAMLASGLGLAGLAAVSAAFRMAPTTGHVAALGPTQPFFSFFIAAILGYVLHRHYSKVPFDRETQIKLFLITGIFGGIYLLVRG